MLDRDWFLETLHASWGQRLKVERVVYREQSDHQDIIVFENKHWGTVLALDGIVQTTTADEFAYHEMLVHPAVMAHAHVETILIIGGGDGGTLREALRYPDVKSVTQVEIDRSVIDLCRTHLPGLSAGAFDDPRAEIVIADGAKYVQEAGRTFDLIIVDSTDPMGPAQVLFETEFYRHCRDRLSGGGVLITQSGNPALADEELAIGQKRLREAGFADVSFMTTSVPTYVGGTMALGWASDDRTLRQQSCDWLLIGKLPEGLRYYNPDVHVGAFAHPNWLWEIARRYLVQLQSETL